MDVTAEFINCTIKDQNMSNFAHTSPFTSLRANLNFTGTNVFQRNNGGKDLKYLRFVRNHHVHDVVPVIHEGFNVSCWQKK